MNLLTDLQDHIRRFLKRTGMSEFMLGTEALSDHHAVPDILEARRDMRLSTVQKLYDYMTGYRREK